MRKIEFKTELHSFPVGYGNRELPKDVYSILKFSEKDERLFHKRCRWHATKDRYGKISFAERQRMYLYGKYLMPIRRAAMGAYRRRAEEFSWPQRFRAFYFGRDLICGDDC